MNMIKIVNVPDVSPGDAFVDLTDVDGRPVRWIGHSGLPSNIIERSVRRPRLSRYRAAWQATGDAKDADLIISHLPRMTTAVEYFAARRRVRRPHLAFSFNFTDLPVGGDLARMKRAFASVERFCVYSTYETQLYPDLFDVAPDRFRHVMWGQGAPRTDRSMPVPDQGYVAAIGGEGRDYAGIVAAARARPDVSWVVIARPNAVLENAPANMTVLYNVPAHFTWGIAERAASVVVPLVSETTCCGHITIASAQLLGLPLISTRSRATTEYLAAMPGTRIVEPGDPDALAAAAADAVAGPAPEREQAIAVRQLAEARYDRHHWATLIADFARDFVVKESVESA